MKAVIWTDVLQAVVIIVGLLATIIQGSKTRMIIADLLFYIFLGLISLGGFKRTFSIASEGARIVFDKSESL